MAKVYKIKQSVMAADEEYARRMREETLRRGILVINIIGSPGAGKTTLLEATKKKASFRFAVIEGDIATSRDAERLAKLEVPAIQINTHGGCHLEANLVSEAFKELPLDNLDVIFIENVGNLVCPAEFDIGEDMKVAVSSLPEGADKPLKYPHLFSEAKAVLLTKMDLVPYIPFDMGLYKND
ncbi:MAG: hydrogenase nickel incorporation protein HypB, partial [Aminobacterium sp.]|nr:hydrogenase nickel incorporation protein HypB [Aminobacterium sp.]